MPGKRKTSVVWEHFTLNSDQGAICKHCNEELKYSGSTGNLLMIFSTYSIFVFNPLVASDLI